MMAAVAGLAGALAIPSVAQNNWHRDRDHDHAQNQNNQYQNNPAYQQGYREGQQDRVHNNRRDHHHRWDNDDDNRAYTNGYNQGYMYQQGPYYNNGYNQPYYNGGGPYYGANSGGHPYGNGSYARGLGYQDGMRDGQQDRSTGHSFRPTHDDNYKNADRGYRSDLGSKQNYKNIYRQGYEQGYQQGYNGGYGYRR